MICGRKPITAPHHHAGPPAPMTCHPRAGTPTPHTNQPAKPLRPRTPGWRVPDHRRDHTRTTCASPRPAGCAHHTHAPPLLAISDNELATANFLAVAGSRHVADLRELSWAVAPWPWGLFISPLRLASAS